jgi:hypothetical protein
MTGIETGLNSPIWRKDRKYTRNGIKYTETYNIPVSSIIAIPTMIGLLYLMYWIWKSDLDMNDILGPFLDIFTAGGQATSLLGVLGGLAGSVGNAAKQLKFW